MHSQAQNEGDDQPMKGGMTHVRILPLVCMAAAACATASPVQNRPAAAQAQSYLDSIPGTLVRFEMVPIRPGRLISGRPIAPFDIQRTETTWDMYDVYALKLDEPANTGGADAIARPSNPYGAPDYGWGHTGFPVMSVTRAAAEEFAAWLSQKTGHRYRLPTEEEWTYVAMIAARGPREAGHPLRQIAMDSLQYDSVAWHRGNSGDQTHAVAKKKPDALGLYDLFGNVAEWVTTGSDSLVTRGGSFRDPGDALGPHTRAVQSFNWNERDPQLPKSRWWLSDGPFVGFRLVRERAPER
jgi:formylglycine-generating enzyme required for sulfatase activity